MSRSSTLRLAFYGDDFTGSTDALEFLTRAGLRTRLFLTPPSPEQTKELDAVGVAGLTRSLAPAAMETELRPAFAALRALGAPHVHYKVCSTFDSSPTVGSIGCAIQVGLNVFEQDYVPLLVAAPALGRYCVFGNLFARYGIGSVGPIYRLDRHPAISKHPVTPMNEADVRRHLSHQIDCPMGLVNVVEIEQGAEAAGESFNAALKAGAEIVFFDALTAAHLLTIGTVLNRLPAPDRPLFSVGSSGIEAALSAHWTTAEKLAPRSTWPELGEAKPLLVVSGSCSPVTADQIAWAELNGFAIVAFDERARDVATAALAAGKPTLICSSRIALGEKLIPAAQLGTALGLLARELVAANGVKRLVVAGGDTSSYAARALGIESLEMIAPLVPGAPLCRARASGSPVDGLEVNFKGGQVGATDYFGAVARGKL